ncbi:ATPase AAA [Alphaproteobacteria bacterium]|nr:ATPase AAA [Alphaproteobacteria bacterium]
MSYRKRIIEKDIRLGLEAAGALWIRGPKSCGKTETAKQFAKSVLKVDTDPTVSAKMAFDPSELLVGDTPRLLDEWQVQPTLWNYVRHEVDDRRDKGQFILTGSATPDDDGRRHSGTGRFIVYEMRTMSWQEMGYSNGAVSLENLFKNEPVGVKTVEVSYEELVDRILKGGWPENLDISLEAAMAVNHGYFDLLTETDISRVSKMERDPAKVKALMKSLARNISTPVSMSTLSRDVQGESATFTRQTADDYIESLEKMMIIVNQPAYNAHIRSTAELRQAPKRHFCDVSLAVEALNLSHESLMNDPNYLGFLFESQAIHDLMVYADAIGAKVSYYRDSNGNEVDAIVETRSGEVALFEVKLGNDEYDLAAENLKKVAKLITKPVKSLNIISGPGLTYYRPDGVNVISLASLGGLPNKEVNNHAG